MLDWLIFFNGIGLAIVPLVSLLLEMRRLKRFDSASMSFSFLSNESLYGVQNARRYRRFVLIAGVVIMVFFHLLITKFDVGDRTFLLRSINWIGILIFALALTPHNMTTMRSRNWLRFAQRMAHNLLALLVFCGIPAAIIGYQIEVIKIDPLYGKIGLILAGFNTATALFTFFRRGITAFSEMVFMIGISVWALFNSIAILFGS